MGRLRAPVMVTHQQAVCTGLVSLLLVSSLAASQQPGPPPVAEGQQPNRPSPLQGGYVRGRDGRRVATVTRHDLAQFRRLVQPQLQRRWLQRRVQPATQGRVVIAYTSALTAGPPNPVVPAPALAELPDRIVTQDRPPGSSEDDELEAAMRAVHRAAVVADGERSVSDEPAEEDAVDGDDVTSDAENATVAEGYVSTTTELRLEGSGESLETTAVPAAKSSATLATVQPLDDQRDLELESELSEDVSESSTSSPELVVSTGFELNTTSQPEPTEAAHHTVSSNPPSFHHSRETAEDRDPSEQDSDVLLAIANGAAGGGTSDGEGSGPGPRHPDSVPATRDVRVHGPHVFTGTAGVQSAVHVMSKTDDMSGPSLSDDAERHEPSDVDSEGHVSDSADRGNVSLAAPVLEGGLHRVRPSAAELNTSGPAAGEPVRREARGSFHAAAPTPGMSAAAISALSVGCVAVVAIVVLGTAVAIRRTGLLKRRSILSDPPLDDTRLSYINASTEFSSSDLGDEMTNLENLDNDSFLNSLESMNDSVAAQSCWSRDIRHSKL